MMRREGDATPIAFGRVLASELYAALKSLRDRCFTAPGDELAWGPVAFELRTPEPTQRAWFHAYLRTTGGVDELPVAHRHRVLAVTDAELFTRLAARLAELPHLPAEDYAGRPYRHGVVDEATFWLTRDPADLLGEPNPYLVIHHDNDWHVLSPPGPAAARNPTLVARELLRWHLLMAGALVVHASAAWHDGDDPGGVMFCGNAGSGKTTLALATAQRGGRFISGDRTALVDLGAGCTVAGIALAARVRPGTLAGLDLERRLNGRTPLRQLPGKLLLTQIDLESLGGIGTMAAAPLRAVVFTERADESPPRLEEATGEQARRLLDPQVLGYDNEWPSRWLMAGLGHGDPPPERARRAAVLTGMESVRRYRLTWDPTRGDMHAALDAIGSAHR